MMSFEREKANVFPSASQLFICFADFGSTDFAGRSARIVEIVLGIFCDLRRRKAFIDQRAVEESILSVDVLLERNK